MKRIFKSNDRVKKIDEPIYFNIDEVLPDNLYTVTINSPDYLNDLHYIMNGDNLEFVRDPQDPKYLLPEMEIIGYECPDDFKEDFDNKIELFNLIRDTEFPEYNKRLRFYTNENNVLVIYLTL